MLRLLCLTVGLFQIAKSTVPTIVAINYSSETSTVELSTEWLPINFSVYAFEPCKSLSSPPPVVSGAVSRAGDAAAICCGTSQDAYLIRNHLGLPYRRAPAPQFNREFFCVPARDIAALEIFTQLAPVASDLCSSKCLDMHSCGAATQAADSLYSMYSCAGLLWNQPRVPIPKSAWAPANVEIAGAGLPAAGLSVGLVIALVALNL